MKTTPYIINDILENIDFESIKDHPNILIAAKFWEEDRYHAAKVCYKFMRAIDDLIDDRKAEIASLDRTDKQALTKKVNEWINCLADQQASDPFVGELIQTITKFKIPLRLFHNFSASMLFDIDNTGFATFDEFLTYSEGASVAPASVFVHLCCLNKVNGEFFPPEYDVVDVARPCAIFSYIVHIIRDFQKDQQNNLNYFALDILAKNGLKPADLRRIADGEPVPEAFRKVIREYYIQAQHYSHLTLAEIDRQSARLDSRYLLSLRIIYALYLQVFQRINVENGNFTTLELNPPMSEVKQMVTNVITASLAVPA
jgi:phytoene/squalene synthetase